MKIEIIFWNLRRANDAGKRKLIKPFLKTQRTDNFHIQETKWKTPNLGVTRSLASSRFMDWVTSCAKGASGGILVMWDKRTLQLEGLEESSHTLLCKFRNVDDNFC